MIFSFASFLFSGMLFMPVADQMQPPAPTQPSSVAGKQLNSPENSAQQNSSKQNAIHHRTIILFDISKPIPLGPWHEATPPAGSMSSSGNAPRK